LRKEHTLRSWNGFLKKLPTLGKRGLVFRGHADSRWSLQTTLERRGGVDMSLDSFCLMMSRALPQIESHPGYRGGQVTLSSIRSSADCGIISHIFTVEVDKNIVYRWVSHCRDLGQFPVAA